MSARKTALEVLIACRREDGWSNGLLKDLIRRNGLDSRDAALATRLSYGVLQNRGMLDHYLKQLLTGKIKDLHPAVRDILHLGLYQILCMDRIPESAAVNESVDLAKQHCKKQRYAPGLVNGVLRSAVREKDGLQPPKSWEDRFSHPQKLIDLLLQDLDKKDMEPMLRANNDTPSTVAQVNTLKTDTETLTARLEAYGVKAAAHPWMENCLLLSDTGNLEQLPAFQEGLFYIQDPASKLAVQCAGIPQGGETMLLDSCAAPGGKSFAAAMIMAGKGQIHSCDVHAHKTQLIGSGAQRLGIENLTTHLQDGTAENPAWLDAMDVVLCDVPCSGYGIIRKKPDIRYKDPDTMKDLPNLQLQILRQQAKYVKKGGVLLYSTCTLLRRENRDVVQKFLCERDDFCLEPLPLPEHIQEDVPGMITLIPGKYDTDGFFICRLRRKV